MTYTSEEKMNIINRMNRGDSIRALCAEYGISRSTLYRWAGDYSKPDSDSGKNHIPTVKDYNTLQRKVEKLENIITILKTVNCTIRAPFKKKLSELELLYSNFSFFLFRCPISTKEGNHENVA